MKPEKKSTMVNENRKVTEMDIDEFMMHGFDSDVETDDENLIVDEEESKIQSNVRCQTVESCESKTHTHKDQLERLKEKDPEFYKFLQENDEELLEFNDSETDDEFGVESDVDEEEKSVNDDKMEDVKEILCEENEEHDDKEKKQKKGKLVTLSMIINWTKGMQNKSLASLKQIVQAFDCAIHDTLVSSEDSNEHKSPKYHIEGDEVFNTLIQTCLKNVVEVVEDHLGTTPSKQINNGRLPSVYKKWPHVKTTMKLYLKTVLQMLRKLMDPSMLCVVLRHTHTLIPYFSCFTKLTKDFIKRMVRMWSSGEQHVRVMAFIGLTKLFRWTSSSMTEFAIKNCKFTSTASLPLIIFMQNSLVEIFSIDVNSTYQQGFVYIRQLAIHLRNAIIQRKKDSYQSVYNWQFIHCLRLWSRVLSEIPNRHTLEPLIYPLVQVTLGVLRLNPTSRYYPLRFHCIRTLNLLSQATSTFIPIAPFLLEILDNSDFNRPVKLSTAKPTSFSSILRVSKQELHTKTFQDSVMEQVVELLLEHFSTHAHSIGFPELAFPCIVQMKQFVKTTKVPRLRKQIKEFLEKLNETSVEVTKKRSTVTFSPKDVEEIEKWESDYSRKPNAIVTFYNRWKTMKLNIERANEERAQGGSEESETVTTRISKKRKKMESMKTKTNNKKKRAKTSDEKSKNNDEIVNDYEDVVTDFQLSHFED
ncbi:nucleolar complex protein 2 homolog isoform X2 [Xenia sp. Carnegie-2017]|uniref:nucleolar complex protein 2 homolog isoform X2 n=1 Tax=Xenia sp. Carnegie-2017 TaxID=2897299 RepID=UPI001F03BB00|nr:nucleolar complex protein 2 homolog isoform X2 [Xenia sp. Carnegie-2017]